MSNISSSLPVSTNDAKPNPNFTRRTANYHPNVWGDYFLSYDTSFEEANDQDKQFQLLKEGLRKVLVSSTDKNFSFTLNFIDSIQRIGVSYHFQHEIDGVLLEIYEISTKDNNIIVLEDDLHQLALLFRLLRQQGYHISPNVFYKFKDQTGNFNETLANDIQGMMSLYEASQLRIHGEEILEEAYKFTHVQLTKSLTTQLSPFLAAQVNHILGQSLHKGIPRLEARHYMSFYEEDPSHDENLLTFAKLDFNMLQKLHRKELSDVTKWWIKDLNVPSKLPFVRDRIVEGCIWTLGVYFEPQYSLARKIIMKVGSIITIMDDVYDAYGTIHELEVFTNAIESRWDICCLVDLPEYMKFCYTTILNVFEEIEKEMNKQGKAYYIEYAKKEMKRLAQAQMTEARWLHCNHTPTINEYMQVATVSIGYPVLIIISFIGIEDTTEEILIWATSHPNILIAALTISRFMDDIAGNEYEQERGHVASSIECYMMQHNTSKQDAIDQLLKKVDSAWKDINEACLSPTQAPSTILMPIVNLTRVMDVFYKDKDIYTHSEGKMKDYIEALLVNKIPVYIP
ncbi:probable terpene synthase 2 isoform X3 [Cajanus cajan]|uniref:probable terpene synthase 2 isoform X3 n=1 Tax=Cajanus cajan TaxID=3821 RepID=UPI0010FB3C91|nr:probable terpene synthase 2 isoform X3 [Cajanus cajan]